MKPTIGFIGLGMMGSPMAERILAAGFPLIVFNRNVSKTDDIVNRGAERAATCAEVGRAADICITMVSDPLALQEIVFSENGIDVGLSPGRIHVDMSTVSPAIIERLSKHYIKKKIGFLHVPVLGGVTEAAGGSLLLFVGGDPAIADRIDELLSVLGSHRWLFPEITRATHMKLICNMFIAMMNISLAQGLVFGKKVGISPLLLLEVLSHSHLNAQLYQTKGKLILQRKFTPARFYIKHLVKDIGLAIDAGKNAGVPLPALEAVRKIYTDAMSSGLGEEDYSAAVKVFEAMAGVEVRE